MKRNLNANESETRKKDIERITKEIENMTNQKRRIFLEATRNILQNEVNTGIGHVFKH